MRKLIGMVLIGSSLVVVNLGCRPNQRHGLILRGDWSLECNRTPWLSGRETTIQESSGGGQGCGGQGCVNTLGEEFGGQPAFPTEAPVLIEGQQTGHMSPGVPGTCNHCGRATFVNRACRTCGKHGRSANAEVGYYNHPRFHPVPTRPVFAPRANEFSAPYGRVMHGQPVRTQAGIPSTSTQMGPTQIELTPPVPVPEEIRAPRPEAQPSEDRVTTAPRRLAGTPRPFSWIFSPPVARGVKSDPRVASGARPRTVRH